MVQVWRSGSGGQHKCDCGAVYDVTIHRFPMRDKDSENCSVCGEQMASWNDTAVPSFALVHNPRED